MAWQQSIHEVRRAQLRANQAELSREWHMATHNYLYCLEQAHAAHDLRAVRYFAGKLSLAYRAMGFISKASYYRSLAG
ncbi:MAG: hypothetical protein WD273_07195 [Trueperaceae bacterium]